MKQALLVAGCLLATTTLFAQTEKGDWAQFGRYAKANKTVKVPSNVVFMGNSITDGWWPADSTFFIRNNFVDRGISGQTTSEMCIRDRIYHLPVYCPEADNHGRSNAVPTHHSIDRQTTMRLYRDRS